MYLSTIGFGDIKEYLHIPIDSKYILSSTEKVRQCTRLNFHGKEEHHNIGGFSDVNLNLETYIEILHISHIT